MHHRRPFPSPASSRRSAYDRRRRLELPEGRGRVLVVLGLLVVVLYVIGLVAGDPDDRHVVPVRAAAVIPTPPILPTTTTIPPPTAVTATTAASGLPTALSRTAATYDGTNVLVLGGRTNQKTSINNVYLFDPAAGTFRTIGTLRAPLHDAAAVTVAGKPILVGGGDDKSYAEVQGFVSGKVTVIGGLPERRADLQAAVIGTTVYVVGGYEGSYDPPNVLASTDGGVTFTAVGTLLAGNRYGSLVAFGSQLYLIGGEENGKQVARVLRIDPTDGSVAQIGALPAPLSNATAFVLEGSIFVAGGRLGPNATDQVLRLDPETGTTTVAGTLPAPLANASVAVVGNTAWLFGGEANAATAAVVAVRAVR